MFLNLDSWALGLNCSSYEIVIIDIERNGMYIYIYILDHPS